MTDATDFKETVKQQADIVRIVGDYVKLKKAGAQNYSGLCPFHNEKTPSFSVHATRQFYHCFGCGVSGDVFSFVQKIENVTFPEAVRAVAQKLGIALPKMNSAVRRKPGRQAAHRAARNPRARLRIFPGMPAAARRCPCPRIPCRTRPERRNDQRIPHRLRAGLRVPFERLGSRAISMKRCCARADCSRGKKALSHQLSALSKASPLTSPDSHQSACPIPLGMTSQRPTTNGRRPPPCIPSSATGSCSRSPTRAGRVIAFTGRTLATDEKAGPKYLNSPETAIYSKSSVLFNLDHAKEAIRKLEYAILVEGQMDCISVLRGGISQRHREFWHRIHRTSGPAAGTLQQERRGEFRSRHRRRQGHRAHAWPPRCRKNSRSKC